MKSIGSVTIAVSLFCSSATNLTAQDAHPTRRDPQPQIRYPLGADSLPNDDLPKGKLEGPYLFHSKIIADTVRKYWVFVPSQHDPDKPACVLVFQDGAARSIPMVCCASRKYLQT